MVGQCYLAYLAILPLDYYNTMDIYTMYNYSMIYTYVQVWVWSLSSRVLLPLEEEVLRKLDSLGAGTKVPFSPGKALRPGGRACQSRFPPFLKEPFLPHDKVSTTGVRGDPWLGFSSQDSPREDPWLGIPAKVPPRTPLRDQTVFLTVCLFEYFLSYC